MSKYIHVGLFKQRYPLSSYYPSGLVGLITSRSLCHAGSSLSDTPGSLRSPGSGSPSSFPHIG